MDRLVGRDVELELLQASLAAAQTGSGGLVLIGGEAGVGKSTLLGRLLADAPGAKALIGRCPGPDETPPYGPFLEILAQLGPDHPLGEGAVANRTSRELAAALLAYLGQQGGTLLLLLEDLHWADPATLEVLRHLAPLLAQSNLLLVATFRNDELNREHPLWSLLPALQRTGAQRLLLSRLDYESVAQLVSSRLPDATPEVARRLHHRTGGNPLFLIEMLAAMARPGTEQGPLPDNVLQAIDLKLGQLSPESQQLLSIGSLIGERFEYSLLAAVAEQPEEVVAEMLEQALALRIIRVEGSQGELFAFDHALVREALLSRMIAPRRRRWHKAIAEALIERAQPDPDSIALHLSRADDPRAVAWLQTAGDWALRFGALAQARQRYERALQLLHGPDRRRGELLLKLGHSTAFQNPEQARQYFEEALEAAQETGDEAVTVWTRHMQLVMRQSHQQTDERTLAEMAALQEWQERLQADEAFLKLEGELFGKTCGYPRIAGERARTLAWIGRRQEAGAVVAAIEAQIPAGPQLADLIYSNVPILIWAGEIDQVFALLRRVRDYRVQLRQYRLAASMEFSRLYSMLYFRTERVAEIEENARALAEYERLAIERAGDGTTPGGYSVLGVYQFFRGDWEGARRNLLDYYRQYPQEDRLLRRVPAAQLARALGDLEMARSLLALFRTYTPGEPHGPVILNIELPVVWAEWHMDMGDLSLAAQWLEFAEAWERHLETVTWRGMVAVARARLHLLEGRPAEGYAAIESAFADPFTRASTYWHLGGHRIAGELAVALGRRAEAEQHLRTSIALAEAWQIPYEGALSRLALGSLLPEVEGAYRELVVARESLARLGATAALRKAEEALAVASAHAGLSGLNGASGLAAASALGGASGVGGASGLGGASGVGGVPGLAGASALGGASAHAAPEGDHEPLTEREREIVRLVAQGQTDKEVAAQLFISPRTVDRHLRNIFVKLNISSRTALGAYAVRAGLLE